MLNVHHVSEAREHEVVDGVFVVRLLHLLDLRVVAAVEEAPNVDNDSSKHEERPNYEENTHFNEFPATRFLDEDKHFVDEGVDGREWPQNEVDGSEANAGDQGDWEVKHFADCGVDHDELRVISASQEERD